MNLFGLYTNKLNNLGEMDKSWYRKNFRLDVWIENLNITTYMEILII